MMMMGLFFLFFWGVIVLGGIKRKVADIFLHHESNVDSTFINLKIMKKKGYDPKKKICYNHSFTNNYKFFRISYHYYNFFFHSAYRLNS